MALSIHNWDKFVCDVMASRMAMIDCTVQRKLMLLVKWIRGSYIRSKSALNVIVASLVRWLVETCQPIGGLLPPSHSPADGVRMTASGYICSVLTRAVGCRVAPRGSSLFSKC